MLALVGSKIRASPEILFAALNAIPSAYFYLEVRSEYMKYVLTRQHFFMTFCKLKRSYEIDRFWLLALVFENVHNNSSKKYDAAGRGRGRCCCYRSPRLQ